MYESHFGLSGAPFQLSPDPNFFFDSRGHKSALAYLQFGAHQGEGFIVVTGEIGAGKTTVVNALLNGLDRERVVAAKVVSTQLEAGDLLKAIMTAFGVAPTAPSKAQLIATLEAFLTAVAASGRRALLIVDEAQNLNRTAVEELRMLSNFQLGSHSLLQSFLVGQPELRALLQSKSMEQLRQRVIASCHLGPLDVTETQGYIEHRLHVVGWADNPSIDPLAFAEIHRWTEGVPRRINRLCSRLLLAAYLQDLSRIDVALVRDTAQELGAELGDAPSEPPLQALRAVGDAPALKTASAASPAEPAVPERPVLCVVDSMPQYLAATAIAHAAVARGGAPAIRIAWIGSANPDRPIDPSCVLIAPDAGGGASVEGAFERLLGTVLPSAVAVCSSSHDAFGCAMVAFRKGVPVLRLSGGRRRWWATHEQRVRLELFERLATVIYTDSVSASNALHRCGVPVERVQYSGDMALEVTRAALASVPAEASDALFADLARSITAPQGFALAVLRLHAGSMTPEDIALAVNRLEDIARRTPVVWLTDEATRSELSASGHESRLLASSVHLLAWPGFAKAVTLLSRSVCLVADRQAVLVESALALGRPCLVVEKAGAAPARSAGGNGWPSVELQADVDAVFAAAVAQPDDLQDASASQQSSAAAHIADHLSGWLFPAARRDTAAGRPGSGRASLSALPRHSA